MILDFSSAGVIPASGLASLVFALALWYLATVPNAPSGTAWWAAAFLFSGLPTTDAACVAVVDLTVCMNLRDTVESVGVILFAQGLLSYCGRPVERRRLLLALAAVMAWGALATVFEAPALWLSLPLRSLMGLVLAYAAGVFLTASPGPVHRIHFMVGGAFLLLAVHNVVHPLLPGHHGDSPWTLLLSDFALVAAGVGLIIIVQRHQQTVAEQARLRTEASEARLLASESRYRDLIDNAVMGMLISWGNRPLFANAACARIFGYGSPAELVALPGMDRLVHPEEVPRLREFVIARRAGHPAPEQYQFRGLRKDGATIWVESIVRPIEWEGLHCSQATFYDITEARRFEEELRSHQRLLRTVVDSIPHVVLVRDREGRILMVNRAWCEAFGTRSEAVIGKAATELDAYVPAEARLVQETSRAVVASEEAMAQEHEMTIRAGKRRYHTVRTPLRGEDGGVVGVVSVSLDITEQRATEEQLRRAQKMEAVGQLTGGVAHDFNNLLSVILGNLELLETRVEADHTAAGYVTRAMKATERGAALTQRLLAFSRRQTLHPLPVDLARQVGELLELLRSSLGETIRIETHLHAEAGLVLVDPHQVENALVNLALNARDAMPEGGTLTIEVAPASLAQSAADPLGDRPRADWIVLTVRDTGSGMPDTVRERAVEPFFTTKEQGRGSGLGLSMIYGFMDQSGGHMAIDSREGEGTSVRLYFPRAQPGADASHPAAAAPAPPDGNGAVLVVEDDAALGMVAVEMLTALNHRAIVVGDGHQAMRALRDDPSVGLLFTDVVLPNGMDGVMLAGEARRLRPGLKVLFTSGYAESVFARHPTEIVGALLLQKPYRLGDLAQKLEQVLNQPGAEADSA